MNIPVSHQNADSIGALEPAAVDRVAGKNRTSTRLRRFPKSSRGCYSRTDRTCMKFLIAQKDEAYRGCRLALRGKPT